MRFWFFGGIKWRCRPSELQPSLLLLPLLLAVLLVVGSGCGRGADELRNGDLIFVGLPGGCGAEEGSMDAAIAAATGRDGELRVIHVAVAEVGDDGVWVIDATVGRGVDRHPLDTFLRDFTPAEGKGPAFLVRRVVGVDADAAVERAKGFCGREYDVRFLPDNADIYCSELVQMAYLDASGEPVFAGGPMNFRAADGTMPPYWEDLFGRLGMAVPEGLPGTNPQAMFSSSVLVPVRMRRPLRERPRG